MPEHVMLVFNMGHSGGMWLQDICNAHPDVQVWQEPTKQIKNMEGTLLDFFEEQIKSNPHRTIGFIKGFTYPFIDKVFISKSVAQVFRNPIGVVNAKIGLKMEPSLKYAPRGVMETEEDIFEAHVAFYAHRYRTYLNQASKWPLIRLEDLNASLEGDCRYFVSTMERLLNVEWSSELLERNKGLWNVKEGRMARGYAIHEPDMEIFQKWPSWKQKIFVGYFSEIMKESDYSCPSI